MSPDNSSQDPSGRERIPPASSSEVWCQWSPIISNTTTAVSTGLNQAHPSNEADRGEVCGAAKSLRSSAREGRRGFQEAS
jgi:hypothetical protein